MAPVVWVLWIGAAWASSQCRLHAFVVASSDAQAEALCARVALDRPFLSRPASCTTLPHGVVVVTGVRPKALQRSPSKLGPAYAGLQVIEDVRVRAVPDGAYPEDPTCPDLCPQRWGLDRIDQADPVLTDGSTQSIVPSGDGSGVTVFVVDSGIHPRPAAFGDRIREPEWVIDEATRQTCRDPQHYCTAHGTHMAGLIGGEDTGVATAATLVPVNVFDNTDNGCLSDVARALAIVLRETRDSTGPAVVNMSLECNESNHDPPVGGDCEERPSDAVGVRSIDIIDQLVTDLLAQGVLTVVAAGNQPVPSQGSGMASLRDLRDAIVVGKLDPRDAAAFPVVDGVRIYAPGHDVRTIGVDRCLHTQAKDTSAATALTTGVIAVDLANTPPVPGESRADLAGRVRDALSHRATPATIGGHAVTVLCANKDPTRPCPSSTRQPSAVCPPPEERSEPSAAPARERDSGRTIGGAGRPDR